jgi:hypothetical protein
MKCQRRTDMYCAGQTSGKGMYRQLKNEAVTP